MAAKKSKPKTSLNKSEFIRANPSLSTADLIEKAKKQGVELSTAYVYTLRSTDRKKVPAPSKAKSSGGREANGLVALKPSGSAEQELERLVMRIGTDRASEVFQKVLAKVLK